MFNWFISLCNWISTFEISYKGGAVFLDIVAWGVIAFILISPILGYEVALIKK